MCVCAHACAHAFLCDTAEFLTLPSISVTHAQTHTHVPARRVQVCDGLGVLGTGHPPSVLPSAPSSELALARGQTATSICLVNTEISKAHPSPRQKITQARPARAKIARSAESVERTYLSKREEHKLAILGY